MSIRIQRGTKYEEVPCGQFVKIVHQALPFPQHRVQCLANPECDQQRCHRTSFHRILRIGHFDMPQREMECWLGFGTRRRPIVSHSWYTAGRDDNLHTGLCHKRFSSPLSALSESRPSRQYFHWPLAAALMDAKYALKPLASSVVMGRLTLAVPSKPKFSIREV